ncbi:MAG: hypothetical protein MJ231_00625 [bacterium]|nr:hypothetical protein [bacterium]
MLSINTNLSSMIAQQSLTKSTDILNQAIERMTTGAKLNHASDNAANYSIATNMTTQLNSYEVAQDNVAAGMDLVSVASDSLSLISNHASRIRDLCMQAKNGTYGEQSLKAIQSEVDARIAEIVRQYNTTEYNGINLLNKVNPEQSSAGQGAGLEHDISPKANGFIDDIEVVTPDIVVSDPTQLADAIAHNSIIGISNAETLAKLAELVNSGTTCLGKTITLTADIDLSAYSTGEGWTPIGTSSRQFRGNFDGQGHKVKNLYINRPDSDYQGLFGYVYNNAALKNVGIENCNVTGKGYVGGLAGIINSSSITNSYATGDVIGNGERVGGLTGDVFRSTVTNSYATGDVTGQGNSTGGLVGIIESNSTVTNSYATGDVIGNGERIGGLVGFIYSNSTVTNSYATGDVTGQGNSTGGLVGYASSSAVRGCDAAGSVTGQGNYTGGLTGAASSSSTVTNCYATGSVTGHGVYTGGLTGAAGSSTVTNCYATGSVTGQGNFTGGLVGCANNSTVTNSYATGNVTGHGDSTGGLVGYAYQDACITNCISYVDNVTGRSSIGSFCGNWESTSTITNCKTTEIAGLNKVGTTDAFDDEISYLDLSTTLQVGINSDSSCQIKFNTDFSFVLVNQLNLFKVTDENSLDFIDNFLSQISAKQTEFGAVQNRLDSALEEIGTHIENLTSSRSTLKDADIAKESSEYIRGQILQQASATLLSTANQSPAIVLTLLSGIR